jgi:GT2 family glycosyltransferase
MDRSPDVSIVVPTFQRRERLARLVAALAGESMTEAFEAVVVDDGSTDGTLEWLANARPPFPMRSVAQGHLGPAAARNRGLAESRAPLILFLDDDVVPEPGLIAAHRAAHADADDRVVVGPMLPPSGQWQRPAWIRWEEEMLLAQYRAMRDGLYSCTPRQFFTGNASVSRKRLLASGGFDPRFVRAEDVELGYRLRNAGMRFVFASEARVRHYPDRTFASWRRTPYLYGRADVAMSRDKGHESLDLAYREFHRRRRLNRFIARICVGRPALTGAFVGSLGAVVRVADAVAARRVAAAGLSAIFNVLYWQGIADESGGRDAVWRSVKARAAVARA